MKKDVVVYGMGSFYYQYKSKIAERYNVVGVIDKNGGDGVYRSLDDNINLKDNFILIMLEDMKFCFEVVKMLLDKGVSAEKIFLGIESWGEYSKYDTIKVRPDGKLVLKKGDITIAVNNVDEFYNVTDTILNECYRYYLQGTDKEIVLDIGMNIGDATLFFLKRCEKVEKVYAFEPFEKTYADAVENLKNFLPANRVKLLQIGLSDRDEKRRVRYNATMSCGQSTNDIANEVARGFYNKASLLKEEQDKETCIVLRKASNVIKEIKDKHKDRKLIVKMDCEGEEYAIIKDLVKEKMLQYIDVLMMEWHYKGAEELLTLLKAAGFAYFSMGKSNSPALGLIYAWR